MHGQLNSRPKAPFAWFQIVCLLLAGLVVSGTPGCQKPAESEEDQKLVILCGNSFRAPMEKLVAMYEDETGDEVEMSFGGSEEHLPNVKLKSIGDIFVAHTPFMADTEEAGAMARWVHVGDMAPVLVVPKGNPKGIEKFEDLANDGLQVILPNPEFSTCGEMVFALMEKKGIKDEILANVGNAMSRSHSDIGNKMKLGTADAAMMWNAVAAEEFGDALEIVPTPYEYDTEIQVGVMGLSYSEQPEKVEEFMKFVDEHGKEVFAECGYVR